MYFRFQFEFVVNGSGMATKDKIREFFTFSRAGRLKSSVGIYSFSLSILYLIVYAAAFYLLANPLHGWVGEKQKVVEMILESIIPSFIGTIICLLPILFKKKKNLVFMAYIWLCIYALIVLIAMLIMLRSDQLAAALFFRVFAIMVPFPLILGIGLSWLYLNHWEKKNL